MTSILFVCTIKPFLRGAWLAQSEEHAILDLRVMSLSPTLGVEITKKKKQKKP